MSTTKLDQIPRAICFDLDGTLLDSENYYYETMGEWLQRHFGVSITKEEYVYYETVLDDKIIEYLLEQERLGQHTLSDEPSLRAAIADDWLVHYDSLIESAETAKNAALLHAFEQQTEVPLALVSCSQPVFVDPFVDAYGLDKAFSLVLTGASVKKLKPDPEIYQLALDELGLPGSEVATVEDAARGIIPAQAVGMTVVRPLAYLPCYEPLANVIETADIAGALDLFADALGIRYIELV
ncbi:MAG: HAD family phosphatase [Actinomycetia bacterium]|nr:HAD family phosphatase [Actinomycetes bacterium]